MNFLKATSFLILYHLLPFILNAQPASRTVSGTVRGFEESLPLEGVKVEVKGTGKSSGTQADGIYYINVNAGDSVLIFSYPGYEVKEIKLTQSVEYNVVLQAAASGQKLSRARNNNSHERCRR